MSSQSSGSSGSGLSTSGLSYPNTGAQSTLGNFSQAPSTGQNGMNGYVQNSGVGNSQLGGGLISASGQPMTLYQALLQSGRATSGY